MTAKVPGNYLASGSVTAAVAALTSGSMPRLKECGFGRSAALASSIHCQRSSSSASARTQHGGDGADRPARAFISGPASASGAAVSRCPSVRLPGLVSRIRTALRGTDAGARRPRGPG